MYNIISYVQMKINNFIYTTFELLRKNHIDASLVNINI